MSEREEDRPTVFSDRREIVFQSPLSEGEIKVEIVRFVADLTASLDRAGCLIIGHIKGKLDVRNNGSLFFNVTTFLSPPHIRGTIIEPVDRLELTINIIVYSVTEEQVQKIYCNSGLISTSIQLCDR